MDMEQIESHTFLLLWLNRSTLKPTLPNENGSKFTLFPSDMKSKMEIHCSYTYEFAVLNNGLIVTYSYCLPQQPNRKIFLKKQYEKPSVKKM